MPANWVPTQTFHSFKEGEDPGGSIPESEWQQLKDRVAVLESTYTVMSGQIANNTSTILSLSNAAKEREFAFLAEDAVTNIGGGLWKLCGAYRCFETMTLDFVRGYSMEWPSGSSWQLNAMRTDGSTEVQNIGAFSFDMIPSINLQFQAGDILAILVRNFSSTTDPDTGETTYSHNPAMCSMVFTRAVL